MTVTDSVDRTSKDCNSSSDDGHNKGEEYVGTRSKMDDSEVHDDDDDDDDDGAMEKADLDKIMDASDIINSMRSVVSSQLRKLEPPMPLFTRPTQRQRWGDVQVTPHKEWGDIFFDLFYVAGAYNLGNLLREEPTMRGLFYFVSCFFPIQSLWQYKMYWDARFYTLNDVWHNFYDVCTLVVLASAVLHIRPVAILSNPEENNDLFVFCCSISIGMLLVMGRSIEVIFFVDGEEAARKACKRECYMYGLMTLFLAAATIFSAVKYYTNDSDDHYDGSSNSSSVYGGSYGVDSSYTNNTNSSSYNTTTSSEEEEDQDVRFLAGASDGAGAYGDETKNNDSGDVAMGLLLGGFCFNHVFWFVCMVFILPRLDDGDFKKSAVPMNVDYAIHRYGEWTMLMLGETVLSLLIVGVKEEADFYKIFYSGILSISLLEYMHFRSQPHHADEHAMRRKKERGYAYVILVQLYSGALIVLGASYKMLLYEFNYADEGAAAGVYGSEEDPHRRMLFAPPTGTVLHRLLAGGGGDGALNFSKEDREQRTAHLFCGSMAAVFLLCDLLIVIHKGLNEHMERCKNNHTSKAAKLLGLPLFLLRIGLIAFMASLSQYTTDGSLIAFVGLICIFAELVLRVVGTGLFKEETEEDEIYQEILQHGIETE